MARRLKHFVCASFVFLFFAKALCAQYPSASYHHAASPMLAEQRSNIPPSYNPAFLGLGADNLREDLSRRFHMNFLDILGTYNLLSNLFLTDPPDFEDTLNSRVNELVQGLSVTFTNLQSRTQMYQDALADYTTDITTNVVPPLVAIATGKTPNSLNIREVLDAPSYMGYKARLEGDATMLLGNIQRVIGEVGTEYLNEQPVFNSEFYIQVFDIEFLLGQQVSMGFGANIRSYVNVKEDLSDFEIDLSSLSLPSLVLPASSLPTDWTSTILASTQLNIAIAQASTTYITNLAASLSAEKLLTITLKALFDQSFIDLFYAIEPNIRVSVGFPIADWLYIGTRVHGELILGLDGLMIPESALNVQNPQGVAEYIYDPQNYSVSFHAGWDVSAVLRPFDWLTFSLMVTDVLGLAPGPENASTTRWGDFYYPIDIRYGVFAEFPLGINMRLGFGADIYDFLSLLGVQNQRFSVAEKNNFIDYFRAKLFFQYTGQFQTYLHYWNRSIGLGVQFDFLTFHPSLGVEFDFDLRNIRLKINLFHFTN